jgi:hypothetical protein
VDEPDSSTVTQVLAADTTAQVPPVQNCREMAPALNGSLPTEIFTSDPWVLFNHDYRLEHPVVLVCTSLSQKSSIKHPEL